MKKLLTIFLFTCTLQMFGQNPDTTIYNVVDVMPRFPGCEELDTTLAAKTMCSQTALLMFLNRNIIYPLVAREQNIEGTVVVSFIVEPTGYISNAKLIKDIGGGCGEEAMRVVEGMNEALQNAKVRWMPGLKDGKAVRVLTNVPIKFQLKDPPDFVIIDFDTVYVVLDEPLTYKAGHEALDSLLQKNLKTPTAFKDSCKIGSMDMALLVYPSGYVKVLDVADYWNLGYDFQFEAILAAGTTYGQWNPGVRKGRKVPASYETTITFSPIPGTCLQKVTEYEKAIKLADEGSVLFNEGKQEEGIVKLDEALALFPDNANFLYLRGQAYMNTKQMDKACADFKKVSSMIYIDMVEQLIPLVCK